MYDDINVLYLPAWALYVNSFSGFVGIINQIGQGKASIDINVDFHNLFILKRSTIDLFESR